MSDGFPMTQAGYAALKEELRRLKSVDRPEVILAIAEARAHGDLSENAEYAAAREKQSWIEARIKLVEEGHVNPVAGVDHHVGTLDCRPQGCR